MKGKHSWILSGINIDQNATGKAVAWCPGKLDSEGGLLPVAPIGQLIHVPIQAKKPVLGVTIEPTTVFLTRKLAELTTAVQIVDNFEAEQRADPPEQDGDDETRERPRRRRRRDKDRSAGSSCAYYEQVDIDHSLFPDNKNRGKYSDEGEGDL